MLLNEFIYLNTSDEDPAFDSETDQTANTGRYDSSSDTSVISPNDLRKTRLTLKMLNRLRLAGDARKQEQKEDLELVRTMYAPPPQPQM